MENKIKVFIISNVFDAINTLEDILKEDDCEVFRAQSLEYDNYILSDNPDCIIVGDDIWRDQFFNIDISVKGMFKEGIPVIFFSSNGRIDDISESFSLGADDFIKSPFISHEILSRVYNQISIKRREKSLYDEVGHRTSELVRVNELLKDSVDEYKEILKELQDNETLLLTIALNIPNSYLIIIEKNLTVGFASGQEFKKSNIDPWRLVGLPVEKIYKEKYEYVKNQFIRAFAGEEVRFDLEFNNQFQLYRIVPLYNGSGFINRILVVAENITEQKTAEDKIIDSLREKEALLKEIHHRVKNNMQLVCSMMNLHAEREGNSDVTKIIKVLQSRIYSISLVHETLYRHKQFSKINFGEYIKELVRNICSINLDDNEKNVKVDIIIQDEFFTIEKAIPCGLILNELVVNSCKHAFADRNSGVIKIIFENKGANGYLLSVIDNGVGLPEGFNISKTESMGMTLVRELVNQLNGEISVINSDETVFSIVFGKPEINDLILNRSVVVDDSSKNILIVENERIISRMLRKILEDQGYNIMDAVSSGKDAIDVALKYNPDLIIMDIMLDDEIDGVQAASVITKKCACPIIFLTGNSDPVTIKSAWDTNPFQMLTKPIEKCRLINVIESVFI